MLKFLTRKITPSFETNQNVPTCIQEHFQRLIGQFKQLLLCSLLCLLEAVQLLTKLPTLVVLWRVWLCSAFLLKPPFPGPWDYNKKFDLFRESELKSKSFKTHEPYCQAQPVRAVTCIVCCFFKRWVPGIATGSTCITRSHHGYQGHYCQSPHEWQSRICQLQKRINWGF